MAKADETPIYVAAYKLLTQITQLVGNFPRNRRVLAAQMFEEAHRLVQCVFRANYSRDKVPLIRRAQEYLGSIRLSLRLSTDFGLITPRQFGTTVETATEVGKQASGWIKYMEGRA